MTSKNLEKYCDWINASSTKTFKKNSLSIQPSLPICLEANKCNNFSYRYSVLKLNDAHKTLGPQLHKLLDQNDASWQAAAMLSKWNYGLNRCYEKQQPVFSPYSHVMLGYESQQSFKLKLKNEQNLKKVFTDGWGPPKQSQKPQDLWTSTLYNTIIIQTHVSHGR